MAHDSPELFVDLDTFFLPAFLQVTPLNRNLTALGTIVTGYMRIITARQSRVAKYLSYDLHRFLVLHTATPPSGKKLAA
jgi:hypothetical protein